jgi:hypothetical protein
MEWLHQQPGCLSRDQKQWGSEMRASIAMAHEWGKDGATLERVTALEGEVAELRAALGQSHGREGDTPEPPVLEAVE